MTISTPILTAYKGASLEAIFACQGDAPKNMRVSAYITPLMSDGGNIMLECKWDESSKSITVGLPSAKSSKLSPGRYSYSIELQYGGSKNVFKNYLLVEP